MSSEHDIVEKVNSTILGAAAEHYVLCQLLRRNMTAGLAPAGAPRADIIVSDADCGKLAAIQVKARRDIGSDHGWHMKAKHEEISEKLLFYCFVDFGSSLISSPQAWIVPSEVVARVLRIAHQTWLATPGQRGQARNDNAMRRFVPSYHKLGLAEYSEGWLNPYLEAWHLIETGIEAT